MQKRGFTLIELIVVMAIISILVLLGVPKYKNYVEEARKTKITNDIKVIENAVNVYYMKKGDFPRLSDTSYTKSEIEGFANIVYDLSGNEVELDESGKFYDIDYSLLLNFNTFPNNEYGFILQNPVGNVYYLDKNTEHGKDRIKALKQGVKNVKEEIDVTAPEITVTLSNTLPTYSEVIAQAAVNKGSLETDSYKFTENGRFIFKAKSINGIEVQKTVTVDNILSKIEVQREILDSSELSETLEVPNLDRIHSVTVDNGDINYIANENSVSVLVSNSKITESTDNTQKYSKEITELRNNSNNVFSEKLDYTDEEGYIGQLNKDGESVVVSGEYISEDRKTEVRKIEKQESTVFPLSLNYSESGYTGTLLKDNAYYQDGSKTESKEVSDFKTSNINSFVNSLNYNSDGYIGELTKNGESKVISGTYTAAETKEVVAQDSPNYNKDGYVGTLTQYVYSGEYIPADTIFVTGQTSSSYNSGGYSGTLSQYVYSGTYTPADTKTATNSLTSTTNSFVSTQSYNSDGYSGTLSKNGASYVVSGKENDTITKYAEAMALSTYYGSNYTYYYGNPLPFTYFWYKYGGNGPGSLNDIYYRGYLDLYNEGYTGNLTFNRWTDAPEHYDRDEGIYYFWNIYTGYVTKTGVDTRVWKQDYSGSVTKPASDTRVYKYQGYVTKPAVDTRIYKYKGNVTKSASDTRVWQQDYKGTVTKTIPLYTQVYSGEVIKSASDTREWQQNYRGTVYKAGQDNKYKYNIVIEYFKQPLEE